MYSAAAFDKLLDAGALSAPFCAAFSSRTSEELEAEWAKYPHLHTVDRGTVTEGKEADLIRWLLIQHQVLWSQDPKEVSTELEPYEIELEGMPRRSGTRPVNPNLRDALGAMTTKQLLKRIIEPSSSRFSSAVVLCPTKDGKLRFAIDYRNLNKCIKEDRYPTPNVDTALSLCWERVATTQRWT